VRRLTTAPGDGSGPSSDPFFNTVVLDRDTAATGIVFLICDEAQLLAYPALEQLPLLLNFDMDSSRYLTCCW
jgi:hypothetical protein